MEKRQDIQFLRGISFLIVFLFHLQIFGFENGFLGVDIFFVVSGFLMALLYINSNPLRFYKLRASRLLPAFFSLILFLFLLDHLFSLLLSLTKFRARYFPQLHLLIIFTSGIKLVILIRVTLILY